MKFLLSVLALSFAAIPALAMDNFVLEDEIATMQRVGVTMR